MALPAPSSPIIDPLSHARAAFTNHIGRGQPVNGNAYLVDQSNAEGSKDAQAREAEAALKDRARRFSHVDGEEEDGDWRNDIEIFDTAAPPRINPFHLLSHPNTSSALPPLPPHLQALASDTGDPESDLPGNGQAVAEESHKSTAYSTTSNSRESVEPQIHITKVTKDTVHIVPTAVPFTAEIPGRPKRMLQKVGNVFKRDPAVDTVSLANGMAQVNGINGHGREEKRHLLPSINALPSTGRSPVMMQGPPPSPPISDVDVEVVDSEESHSITTVPSDGAETTTERIKVEDGQSQDGPPAPVSEVTKITILPSPSPSKRLSIYTTNLTAEPISIAESSPTNPDQVHDKSKPASTPGFLPTRRVSGGSTSSRTGSLAVVRSGRLANQRATSVTSVDPIRDATIQQAKADNINRGLEPALECLPGGLSSGLGLGLSQGKDLPPIPASSTGSDEFEPPSALAIRQSSASSTPSPTNTSNPSFLHPSSAAIQSSSPNILPPRMTRRSTNPGPIQTNSPIIASPRSPLIHSQSTFHHSSPIQRSRTNVPGIDGAALDSDILAQAETIRRERLERRQKKLSQSAEVGVADSGDLRDKQEVGAGITNVPPTAREVKKDRSQDETKVLVGNLIGEDHVNYVLMYNMLTGIRIGVSRCQAKIKRPLTDEDFLARHKFSFDVVGNELTPSAKYDFKFKDYAPWVFRDLRDDHFHLDPADYLLSLTAKYILSELGSPGKSGSFFYFSRDYRFIIKTISHSEHKFLRSILKDYHEHITTNPHTLLSRFYGLHRVKLPRGRKIHFVIMNNLFPPHRDIHETYDLKGSAYGREYPEEKALKNPRAVLKDKNWVNRNRTLELGPEKRALLSEQLRRDMEFLKKMRVMDYSLLVGIHNMERGNRDNLRENQLSVFHPEMPVRRKPSAVKPSTDASNVRKAIRRSDPKMLDVASQLPSADSSDRRHFLFYQDEGGLRATDEANQNMDVIYYLGVIDICTPYNLTKRLEHFWKSMTEDRHTISAVDPVVYGQRFLNFLMSVMRGGDLSLRPEGLTTPIAVKEEKEKPVGEAGLPPVSGTDSGFVGNDTVPEESEQVDGAPGLSHQIVQTSEGLAIVGHLKAE